MSEQIPWRRRPLFRLLPLLVIGGLGILLWEESNPPEKRLVRIQLHGLSNASAIDLQIAGPDGELIQRTEQFFTNAGPSSALELNTPLRRGTHAVRAFSEGANGTAGETASTTLEIGEAESYDLRLFFRKP